MENSKSKITIIGAGNLGGSLALGLVKSGKYAASDITITRRNVGKLESFENKGFKVTDDNEQAIAKADVVVLAVLPQQFDALLKSISTSLKEHQPLVVSLISGVEIATIKAKIGDDIEVIRAMPNTAIAIQESMTCICCDDSGIGHMDMIVNMFETVGKTMIIKEEHMSAATVVCASGIAFFLRAIRAASQGGIEIGFHADEALAMAAQTAKGAASLLVYDKKHPEREIDKVTSPEGCTIAGLNAMEHQGFSSALIKGITTSAAKVKGLYKTE